MRRLVHGLVLGLLAVAAWRLLGHGPLAAASPRSAETGSWGALSFALAAVVDPHRRGIP